VLLAHPLSVAESMPVNEGATLPEKPHEFRYANYFEIGFNRHEVIIDCGQYYPGDAAPLIHTRLITTPVYAERLLDLLQDSLQKRKLEYDEPHQQ
jgi:hypothetical protein